ncbi:MAG: hypothetical protein AB8B65_20285 [Kordia sp.]|uniref:hypothetical protein n=1 Tax=Kordia sp. TaxID=1965332 RepID=UPI003858D475
MIFKSKTIQTELSKEATLAKIEAITKPFDIKNTFNFNTDESHQFEGQFDDFSFTLFPLFNYGLSQLLRPKILGKIETSDTNTMIKLEFHLPKSMLYLLVLIMGFVLFLLTKEAIDSNKMMIFSAITVLVLYFGYVYKVNKAVHIIESELITTD